MTESTAETLQVQPANNESNSIFDALTNAVKEAHQESVPSKEDVEEVAENEEEAASESEEIETSVENEGGNESQEEVQDDSESSSEEADEDEDEFEDIIPKEWNKTEREAFEGLSDDEFITLEDGTKIPNPKKVLIDRYKNLKKGFQGKSKEVAEIKQDYTDWKNIVDPVRDQIEASGRTPQQLYAEYINTDLQLSQDPVTTLQSIIQNKGLDVKQVIAQLAEKVGVSVSENETGQDDLYIDDDVKAYIDKKMGKGYATPNITKQANKSDNFNYKITQFEQAKDVNGRPLYEHFGDQVVKGEMAKLLNSGIANSLEDAYKQSPTVAKLIIQQQQEIARKEALEKESIKKKQKIAKAKKASKVLSNNKLGIGAQDAGNLSMNDLIAGTVRQIMNQ